MEITAYAPEPCHCARPRTGRKLLECVRTFRPAAGVKASAEDLPKIQRDLVRMRRLLTVEASRTMTAIMREHLETTIEDFANRVLSRLGQRSAGVPYTKAEDRPEPVTIDIDLGGANEAVWANALSDVLGEQANIRLVTHYLPVAQSIAARAYERTSIIIGEELAVDANVSILRRAQGLAKQVTKINETTRKHLAERLARGVEEGATPYEIAQAIKAEVSELATARLPTIVRTEVGRALDEGTKQAIKESSTITHVSVIGCKAREANSPQYNGGSTCNAVDVPVQDIDLLVFHINHTGALIPSKFIGGR